MSSSSPALGTELGVGSSSSNSISISSGSTSNPNINNAGDIASSSSGSGSGSNSATQAQSQGMPSASVVAIARAISPPTPAPSPQPSANAIRLAQAHAHARAMAAVADAAAAAAAGGGGAGPSSALVNSFTAMPSTPPHQEDAKLTPLLGSLNGAVARSSDLITMTADRDERSLDSLQSHLLLTFPSLTRADRLAFLSALIPLSSARELAHLQSLIIPNLKVDFLSALPYELALHVLSFIDEPVTLARCAAVSRRWRALVNDEGTWMAMCKKAGRARPLVSSIGARRAVSFGSFATKGKGPSPPSFSYKKHIKLSYVTDSNWRRGGRLLTSHQSLNSQTVTSLAVDRDWIVVGMASSKIHVFDARTGLYYATLRGHETGVWALAMVSGSRRRDSVDPEQSATAEAPDATIHEVDEDIKGNMSIDGDGDVAMSEGDNDMRSRLRPRPLGSASQQPEAGAKDKGKRKVSESILPGSSGATASSSKVTTDGSPRQKNRIDQARSAAELVKMVAAGASRREGSAGPSSSTSQSPVEAGSVFPPVKSEPADDDVSNDDEDDEAYRGVRSRFGLLDEGAGDAGSSGVDTDRRRPYKRVGDDELQLTYYDPKPCEDMDGLYAAVDDAYAESHPPLPSPLTTGGLASSSLFGPGFRDGGGARAVSASVTPNRQGGPSLLPAHAGGGGGARGMGLFGGAADDMAADGPRYGLFGRQERESPSSRQHQQRISLSGPSSSSSLPASGSSSRRSMPADAKDRFGLGRPSTQLPAFLFDHSEEDAAEARMAWDAAGLPRTGNAVGLGNPCGSSAGFGNDDAIIVSGSCDRDVRVWDVKTKRCKFVLSGHTSTVRCLKVLDGRPIAVSGSRDTNLRIWDLSTGKLLYLCAGHTGSVRCLEAAGDRVVSGSYDNTCRIWDVETGTCLHILEGHHHYIYAVAFDGRRVATGSLDTTIRVWDADNGECLALFTGHTSLVGHLQLRDDILVSGGSDGRVIVFSLKTNECIHRLCAHDNSVTSLQFDERFIVTGANDGRVKVWDFRTGKLLRELVEVTAGAVVWKVSFKDDQIVALYTRDDKTVMDVISFRPTATA
ncbi:hypothetical protein A4X09_0g6977 [Tilletia walkeri]|uniref:F-box domain-containing protein n=1 Tax=Tilletia walkeri TaxID=117179 RepID=A0A8X7N2P8_9BASI|nr:hypothetical protein A4X09_0g6977 [Tilletia walkeri]